MRDKWNALSSWRTQTDGRMSQDMETIQAFVAVVIIVGQRERVSRLGVRGQVMLAERKECARGRGVASERGKRESKRGMCEWGSWAAATAHAQHECRGRQAGKDRRTSESE